MRVGLALGGGGARGFAHIGVLEVLEQEGISIDVISGTSMGAVVGALYAQEKNVEFVKEKIFSFIDRPIIKELEEKFTSSQEDEELKNPRLRKTLLFVKEIYLWNIRLVKKWLVDYKPFEILFKEVFGDSTFSDCKIPFVCMATDLVAGKEVYLEEGLLWEALLASTALPGVFPPLKLNERFLVDGGVLASLPCESLVRKKVDFITAVNLERTRRIRFLKSSMNMLLSVDEMRHGKLVEIACSKADFLFEPDTLDFGWTDFSRIYEIIDKGRQEAQDKVGELKKKLRYRRFFPFLK
ncbi:MAG: patatin-like phospholipase family protein [Candidatus Omnitrophica bacterium]|nr:patatin-like phospholipase family protein [Candidatus Omnitrophota bacterium]